MGKRLSIARSDAKQNTMRIVVEFSREQAFASDPKKGPQLGDLHPKSMLRHTMLQDHRRPFRTATLKSDDNIPDSSGRNIFAVPINVRTTWLCLQTSLKTVEEGDEKPKSNDEFQKNVH
ncbi:hypothetical protein NC651_012049 [Populus alba x Populus x berolinensis]|nr:hypothetical protein NC651_012049 [Populus alba x Populus x berolinensis]